MAAKDSIGRPSTPCASGSTSRRKRVESPSTPRPRSRWRSGSDRALMTNRLADETSPYLLQHAHNPVDWFPWGEEAFARARAEDKPILLSVGYSACHWCHVMAHESFENP